MKARIITFLILEFWNCLKAQNLEQISKQKPFEVHGTLGAEGSYVYNKGYNNSIPPWNYLITANPIFSIYGIQVPFSLTVSRNSRTFNHPFYQIGIQPEYKWAKGYFGFNQMKWSSGTLDGKTFLGAGVEINPWYIRLGGMYGLYQFNQKGDSSLHIQAESSYRRWGYAIKIGFGKTDNFADLILVKVQDNPNKILQQAGDIKTDPQDNFIVGVKSIQFFKKKTIRWEVEGSVSAFSRNTNSLEINNNSTALKVIQPFFKPRASSGYSWMIHNSLQYKTSKLTLIADYKRIQPEYQSLAANYILSDLQRIQLNENIQLLKNKISLTFMQSYQHDNLNKRKRAQTHRIQTVSGIQYQHNNSWGIGFNYTQFAFLQTPGTKELTDSIRLSQHTHQFMLMPRYNIINEKESHILNWLFSYQYTHDKNPLTSPYTMGSVIVVNMSYSYNENQHNWSVTPNIGFSYFSTSENLFHQPSIGLVLNKGFMKNKMTLSLNNQFSYTINKINGNSFGIQEQLNWIYKVTKSHTLKAGVSYMIGTSLFRNREEAKAMLGYQYSF